MNWPKKLNKNSILIGAVALAGLALGFFCGASAAQGNSIFNYFVRGVLPMPGARPDGSFVLGDFESGDALESWKAGSAKIEIRPENVKEGTAAAKVVFFSHVKVAEFGLKDYFTSRNALFDWSQYKALSFYIFNPQTDPVRILLLVSDRKGRGYKQDIVIPANTGETFTVPLEKISNEINIQRVNELVFFEWTPGASFELYFDEVKLTK